MGYKTYNCPVSRSCGGCEWLAVPYPIQLERKQRAVEELFDGLSDGALLMPIIGMDEPTRCRNKIIVPFARGKGGGMRYGLYAKGSHRIIERPDCLIEDKRATPILDTIARLAKSFKIQPYDEDTGRGFLRHALLRIGRKTGAVLVCLVCAGDQFRSSKAFVRKLREAHPEIETVVMNVNRRQTNVVLGETEHVLYGTGWIEDELLGCRFRISARSFFQVNPIQTERLYAAAIDAAGLSPATTILDAYCGTGTIGIIAAFRGAGSLVGVESNARAIKDARINAKRNSVKNATFVAEDAGTYMRRCAGEGRSFDIVFMDPPRAGSDEAFLDSLAVLSPARVVYISCNPTTQVRDIARLLERGYRLERVQPVDMFPHTKHIETVCSLTHKD